jgi:hypothetical protein
LRAKADANPCLFPVRHFGLDQPFTLQARPFCPCDSAASTHLPSGHVESPAQTSAP